MPHTDRCGASPYLHSPQPRPATPGARALPASGHRAPSPDPPAGRPRDNAAVPGRPHRPGNDLRRLDHLSSTTSRTTTPAIGSACLSTHMPVQGPQSRLMRLREPSRSSTLTGANPAGSAQCHPGRCRSERSKVCHGEKEPPPNPRKCGSFCGAASDTTKTAVRTSTSSPARRRSVHW